MTGLSVTLGVLDRDRKEINIHGSYFHCLSSVPAGQINAKAIESSFCFLKQAKWVLLVCFLFGHDILNALKTGGYGVVLPAAVQIERTR